MLTKHIKVDLQIAQCARKVCSQSSSCVYIFGCHYHRVTQYHVYTKYTHMCDQTLLAAKGSWATPPMCIHSCIYHIICNEFVEIKILLYPTHHWTVVQCKTEAKRNKQNVTIDSTIVLHLFEMITWSTCIKRTQVECAFYTCVQCSCPPELLPRYNRNITLRLCFSTVTVSDIIIMVLP